MGDRRPRRRGRSDGGSPRRPPQILVRWRCAAGRSSPRPCSIPPGWAPSSPPSGRVPSAHDEPSPPRSSFGALGRTGRGGGVTRARGFHTGGVELRPRRRRSNDDRGGDHHHLVIDDDGCGGDHHPTVVAAAGGPGQRSCSRAGTEHRRRGRRADDHCRAPTRRRRRPRRGDQRHCRADDAGHAVCRGSRQRTTDGGRALGAQRRHGGRVGVDPPRSTRLRRLHHGGGRR